MLPPDPAHARACSVERSASENLAPVRGVSIQRARRRSRWRGRGASRKETGMDGTWKPSRREFLGRGMALGAGAALAARELVLPGGAGASQPGAAEPGKPGRAAGSEKMA